jgi:recombination protein U
MLLEELIENSNTQYMARDIAVIQKIATPTTALYGEDEEGKAQVTRVKRQKSTVDFLGRFYDYPIAFDAKNTNEPRIALNRLEPHQLKFLLDWDKDPGSIAFILVGYRTSYPDQEYYIVPVGHWFNAWHAWKKGKGMASIPIKDMRPEWKVTKGALLNTGGGSRAALDYLERIDHLFIETNEGRPEKCAAYRTLLF